MARYNEWTDEYGNTYSDTDIINMQNGTYTDLSKGIYRGEYIYNDPMHVKSANNAIQEEDTWWDRNKDWLLPTILGILTTGGNIAYNAYQQNEQNDYNALQAQINRDFNSAEAEKNREWQEEMSNTAIQRQTLDLIKAGINPTIASGLGGSAITAGSQASGTAATSAGLMNMNMKDMMSTALTQSQIENMRADTDLKYKQTGKSEKEIETMEINNRINKAVSEAEIALKNAQTATQKAQAKKTLVDTITQEYYNWHVQMYGSAPDTTAINKVTSKLEKLLTNVNNFSGTKIASIINKLVMLKDKI